MATEPYLLQSVRNALRFIEAANESVKSQNHQALRELSLQSILPGGARTGIPPRDFGWPLVLSHLTHEERESVSKWERQWDEVQQRSDKTFAYLRTCTSEELDSALSQLKLDTESVKSKTLAERRHLAQQAATVSEFVKLAESTCADVIEPLLRLEARLTAATAKAEAFAGGISEPLQQTFDPRFLFVPNGDGYLIAGFGETGRLSATGRKGLHQLFQLVKTPGIGVPMTNLVTENVGGDTRVYADSHSIQPIADQESLANIRDALKQAKAELEDACKSGDTVDEEHCREEVEKWEAELRKVTGFGGKLRDTNNPSDRLRPSISSALKRAYQTMREANPPMGKLADHFELSVQAEGQSFVYSPAGLEIQWVTNPEQ